MALALILFGCLMWHPQVALSQCTDQTSGCSVIYSDPAAYCYVTYNRETLCCETCQNVNTGISGCEFGDRADCSGLTYPIGCYGNEQDCCGSCEQYRDASNPACEFGDKSTQCASAVASDPSICDVGSNAEICCLSCANAGSGTSSGTGTGGSTVTINSTMEHSIETRVVVDRFAFARWKATVDSSLTEAEKNAETESILNSYIKAVFKGTNAIFGGLLPAGINLDVRVSSVVFVQTGTVASEITPGSGTGEVGSMLDQLIAWLDTNNYATVDHTVLLTALDVEDDTGNSQVLGAAKVGAMCSAQSVSVVEAVFNGNTILTFAHELGHSLNAKHDGDGNGCSQDSKYVMDASKDHNATNNFRFSECSVVYFTEKLQALYDATGGNCLTAENTNTAEVNSIPLGKLYTPDEMCQLTVGPGSHVCRTFYGVGGSTSYSTMCRAIWCATVDGSNRCTSVVAADGFTCGQNKECSLGVCEASSTTNPVTDTCPLGDTPSYADVSFANKTCSELVTSIFPGSCYDDYYYRACCDRCETFKTSTAGCEYGDKSTWCQDPARNYPYTCYFNEDLCCATCPTYADPTLPAGCEYGDRASGCNAQWHCPAYADNECCATCATAK